MVRTRMESNEDGLMCLRYDGSACKFAVHA